jgi:hypothetical protein
MIRFAWMQSRTQAVVAAGGLVVIAIGLAIIGPHLVHLYATNVATCGAHGDCSAATFAFLQNDVALEGWLNILVVVVPGIIGIFWGTPLVAHELETGTFRLAWTQSVSRQRWLAVKLGVVGLASMATAGLLSLAVTWWSSPLDRASMNPFGTFDQRDIVPIGYAAFAFALGVTAGVLIRRTLPAMATTLVAFVAARLLANHWIRPRLISPLLRDAALNPQGMGYGTSSTLFSGSGANNLQASPPNLPDAWIYSTQIVDKTGHPLTPQHLKSACPALGSGGAGGGGGGPGAGAGHGRVPAGVHNVLTECVTKLAATYHEVTTYQPASRYWAFQWYELTIYLVAAVILGGLCIWWVRRRLA